MLITIALGKVCVDVCAHACACERKSTKFKIPFSLELIF